MAKMRGAALGCFLALSAFGQTQKTVYSIHGTVRNAVNREPVKNALVLLVGIPGDDASNSQTRAMLSGPAGEFYFEGLSEGQYQCRAHKWPGYTDENSEKSPTVTLPRSSAKDGIEIDLMPLGAIEGKVIDQYDQPVENVVLDIYELSIFDGERNAINVGTEWTDDRGLFQLTSLKPGKYYVKAQAKRSGTETHFGVHAMRYAPWEAFSPVYLGGATDIGSAAPIVVAAGTRVWADFRLEMRPSFRIRGKVEGYQAPDSVSFELLGEDDLTKPSRAMFDVTTGKFEILDVTPGDYKVRASQGKIQGDVMAHVGGDDVSGISIALLPGVTVRGSMRSVMGLENGPAASSPCQLWLRRPWSQSSVYADSSERNGEFKIADVFPGEYQVRLHCEGAHPLSASFGDKNLLQDPAITISAGVAPPHIEVEYKPGGGTLKVKFASQIPSNLAVLLVQNFSPSAGPVLQPWHTFGGGQLGADVLVPSLAPGDYSVYGLSPYEYAEFRSPAFLQALSGGAKVHIEDGKTAQVTITSVSQ